MFLVFVLFVMFPSVCTVPSVRAISGVPSVPRAFCSSWRVCVCACKDVACTFLMQAVVN